MQACASAEMPTALIADCMAMQVLRFTWARSRLPLTVSRFSQRFTIKHLGSRSSATADMMFPVAHTCFFQVGGLCVLLFQVRFQIRSRVSNFPSAHSVFCCFENSSTCQTTQPKKSFERSSFTRSGTLPLSMGMELQQLLRLQATAFSLSSALHSTTALRMHLRVPGVQSVWCVVYCTMTLLISIKKSHIPAMSFAHTSPPVVLRALGIALCRHLLDLDLQPYSIRAANQTDGEPGSENTVPQGQGQPTSWNNAGREQI